MDELLPLSFFFRFLTNHKASTLPVDGFPK